VDDPANRAARIGGDFDTSTDDPAYRLVVPEDATYRVMVRDQLGSNRSDPRYVYRLVIRREQPDFRVLAIPVPLRPGDPNAQQAVAAGDAILPRGGSAAMLVRADRRDGFAGEIDVSAEGLPAGVTCPGAILGGGVETAWLVLAADEQAAAWSGTIRVVGKAKIGDREVVRYARAGTCVWGTANRQQTPPVFRATRDLGLSVTDKFTAPVSIQVGDGQAVESSLGATFEVPVKVVRRGDFKGDLTLVAVGALAEIKPPDVTIKGDAVDGKIAFAMTKANTSPGSYTFYWKADVKHTLADVPKDNAPKEIVTAWASTPIKLRLLPAPFELSVAPASTDVKQGGKVALPLTLAKRFGFDDRVDITWEPPSGVSGLTAAPLSLEKGQTNGPVEFTVAPNATLGRHTVTIRGRSKFNNVNVETAQQVTLNVISP
jgi:hypothetical protein